MIGFFIVFHSFALSFPNPRLMWCTVSNRSTEVLLHSGWSCLMMMMIVVVIHWWSNIGEIRMNCRKDTLIRLILNAHDSFHRTCNLEFSPRTHYHTSITKYFWHTWMKSRKMKSTKARHETSNICVECCSIGATCLDLPARRASTGMLLFPGAKGPSCVPSSWNKSYQMW